MSFLLGKTQARSNVSEQTSGTHNDLLSYIMGQGFGGLNPGTNPDPQTIEPYQRLFRDQNAQNFAQAKESAGNLTGSGVANYIGQAAGRATSQQGAFLADLFEKRRQDDANRYQQLVLGALGSPAAGVQYTHTPGFLDYAGQALQGAAPFLAGLGGGGAAAGAAAGGASASSAATGGQLGQASVYHFPGMQQFAPQEGTGYFDKYSMPAFVGQGRDSMGYTSNLRRTY